MGIIQFAIHNPVKVTAGVTLLMLFGVLAFVSIPIQLTPDVDQPRITVTTRWTGASAQEIENEIVDEQEEKLKSVSDLKKMTSTSRRGEGTIELEFNVGVDKDAALRDTIEKVNQVSDYPPEVDRPEVVAADAALDAPIAWLMFRSQTDDISGMRDWVDDNVRPLLERVPGVASLDIYGGRERQVQIRVDPAKMAARKITFRELQAALIGQNRNSSAGTISQGKREYTYRTVGEYRTQGDVGDTVVAYRSGGPVFVRDVAEVVFSHEKQYSFVRNKGEPVLALPVRRESGANVIATMDALKEQIAYVNANVLAPLGNDTCIEQVYDETIYIHSAISLVLTNIVFGGLLATAVLLLFLRSTSATLIVALTIPISVIGAFLVVTVLGRSLNVIMLAGMAFAVGMVVDNAVVVLENIFRYRESGHSRFEAALRGAREVWGAILASTLTTVAVFLPVVFVEEEAGQLFGDIAIAISSAVVLSLLVAVMVIPPVAARFLRGDRKRVEGTGSGRVAGRVADLVHWINRRTSLRLGMVGSLMALSVVGVLLLIPPATYLPNGNRNLVFGFLITPPGYSIDELERMGHRIESGLAPYWEAELGSVEADALPAVVMRVGERTTEVQPPPIENFFFVSFSGQAFMGCSSREEAVVAPLVEVLSGAGNQFPGVFSFFSQASLFGRALAGGNTIELEMRSDNEASLNRAAMAMNGKLFRTYGRVRTTPGSFDLGRPELQAVVNRVRAADVGLNVRDVAFTLEAFVNGAYVGDLRDEGEAVDLVIRVEGTEGKSTQEISTLPICTPTGHIIPLATVVDFERRFEAQEIAHSESQKAIRFSVSPPLGLALEEVMNDIQRDFVGPMRAEGIIGSDVVVSMEGNADKLVQTRRALIGSYDGVFTRPRLLGFSPVVTVAALLLAAIAGGLVIGRGVSPRWGVLVAGGGLLAVLAVTLWINPGLAIELLQSRGVLAVIVTYLLMAALFESFVYPFVIMLTVPLATVGGFAGLQVVHWLSQRNPITPIQELDVLTMLGFIILVGIVVNNAILIVHQSLNNMREGRMDPQVAIRESVRTRVRPIFMTALTSIGGMLPLVMMPGSGSELYRGLGSVLVGGLMVATVFTLLVIPAMFSLFVDLRASLAGGAAGQPVPVSSGTRDDVPVYAEAAGGPPA